MPSPVIRHGICQTPGRPEAMCGHVKKEWAADLRKGRKPRRFPESALSAGRRERLTRTQEKNKKNTRNIMGIFP